MNAYFTIEFITIIYYEVHNYQPTSTVNKPEKCINNIPDMDIIIINCIVELTCCFLEFIYIPFGK